MSTVSTLTAGKAPVSSQRKPPGPAGHWLWGNIDVIPNPLGFMCETAKTYGGIVSLRLLFHSAWMITEPEIIESILVTQARLYRKHFAVRILPIALGNGLLTSEGDFYTRQRKLVQPAMQRSQMPQYYPTFISYTQRMLAKWEAGQERDVLQEFMALTLGTASKTMFGADADRHAERVRAALRIGQAEFGRRLVSIFQLPLWVPTPANLRLRRAARDLDEIIYGFIRERRASQQSHNDVLSRLLEARDEIDSTGMSDKQLRDECLTIFLAGQETTALTLAWTWYLLGQHPEAAARVYEEVDHVLQGRVPTLEDLPALTETEGVILEAMRLYPPIYVLGREPLVDTEIAGYHCPRGTTLLMPPYVVHRDPRYFDDPDGFHPERWRNNFEKQLPKCAYYPFSAGPRICLGATFAMVQLKLIVAMIAQQFQFTLAPNQQITPEVLVTLRPQPGVLSNLVRR
jgi:cytochrome P450